MPRPIEVMGPAERALEIEELAKCGGVSDIEIRSRMKALRPYLSSSATPHAYRVFSQIDLLINNLRAHPGALSDLLGVVHEIAHDEYMSCYDNAGADE